MSGSVISTFGSAARARWIESIRATVSNAGIARPHCTSTGGAWPRCLGLVTTGIEWAAVEVIESPGMW
ncbi:hypothetical protein ASG84_18990 [Rhodococcus sp. Leaf278]|nr:hypothetical protein ASG84_18990 [Rhodococcus sp. Leaf278]